jgi:hypothetical protein
MGDSRVPRGNPEGKLKAAKPAVAGLYWDKNDERAMKGLT